MRTDEHACVRRSSDYLAMRRGVGYKLKIEGRMLGQFVGYCDARGLDHVTIDAALGWATGPGRRSRSWWAARLTVVREFARVPGRRSTSAPRSRRRICCRARRRRASSRICTRRRRSPR